MKGSAAVKTRKMPLEYEERVARIYSHILADVNKAITLIHMGTKFENSYAIRKRLAEVNPFYGRQSTKDFEKTKVRPLYNAGVLDWSLKEEPTKTRGGKGNFTKYRINPDGYNLVAPIAAHTLLWFYHNTDICPGALLGKNTGHSSRPPYQRITTLSSLSDLCEAAKRKATEGVEIQMTLETTELAKHSGLRTAQVIRFINIFEELGLVSVDRKEMTRGFAFYKWIGEEVIYPDCMYTTEETTKAIVDHMVAMKDSQWTSPNEVRAALKIEQRTIPYNVLSTLLKQNLVERKKNSRNLLTISPGEKLVEFCDFFSGIEKVVIESLEQQDEETKASELLQEMQEKQRLLTNGSDQSKKILVEMLQRHASITNSVYEKPEEKEEVIPKKTPKPQPKFRIMDESQYM